MLDISGYYLDDKSECKIPPLLENDNIVPDDTSKAQILNDFFLQLLHLNIPRSYQLYPIFVLKQIHKY